MDIICGLVADITTEELIAELGPVQLSSGTAYEIFSGPYAVVPLRTAQTLETKNKLLDDDIDISAVPLSTTSNSGGGKTVSIGG